MTFLSTFVLVAIASTITRAQEDAPIAPPPLPAQGELYHYSGPAGTGQYSADQIADFVEQDREGGHMVWSPGWSEWMAWEHVDVISAAVTPLPPPPPPAAEPVTFSYHGPDGQTAELNATEIAELVRAGGGAHLVWRPGMSIWTPADKVTEVVDALALLPPPLPQAPTPPPLAEPVEPPPPPAATPVAEPILEAAVAEPVAGAGCCNKPSVKMGGEVWFNLTADDLQNAGADAEGAFHPTFQIKRARVKADIVMADSISGRLMVGFPQDVGSTDYRASMDSVWDRLGELEGGSSEGGEDLEISVRDYPDGWSTVLKDAYLDWKPGQGKHRIRAGLQKGVFGSRDWFDGFDSFFLGGNHAYKTLPWRAGHVDTRHLGISYRAAPSDLWALDAQLLNGTGDGDFDENAGKDVVGRVSVDLPVGLGLQASGQYGSRGDTGDASISQFDVSARLDVSVFRFMTEGIYGSASDGEEVGNFGGLQVAGAVSAPINQGLLDHLDFTVRYMFYDPYIDAESNEPYPDAWWITDLGSFLHWEVGSKQHLLTGLVYENYTPQNEEHSVEHSLVGQAIWKY